VTSATGDAVSLADPMLATVRDTPGQWARAVEIARAARLPAIAPRAVVVAGMGGSGVAGDVAALVADAQAEVPAVAVHGEALPAFVGPEDLVVLVSHSGGTQETLACAEQAIDRGAAWSRSPRAGRWAGSSPTTAARSSRCPRRRHPAPPWRC
jgi:glucose/mannose-6-phosphate isomerase